MLVEDDVKHNKPKNCFNPEFHGVGDCDPQQPQPEGSSQR